MTDRTEETIDTVSTEESKEKDKFSPDYLSSLSSLERKKERAIHYITPLHGFDYELCENLKEKRLLYFDKGANLNGKKKYKGVLEWDMDKLDSLELKQNINISNLKNILNPIKDISYEEVEYLFNRDPNFLLASMSLLTSNYLAVIREYDSKELYRQKDIDDMSLIKVDFLFTPDEERVFFTGRTLLNQLAKDTHDEDRIYIDDILRDIDSVIYRLNTGLIAKLARKYSHRRSFYENFQEGTLGLLTAVKKFDIDKHNKFSTYAIWWIRQGITRGIADNSRTIRIPVGMSDAQDRFKQAFKDLEKENGEKPTFDEVWEYCKLNDIKLPKNKKNFQHAQEITSILSLDKEVDAGEFDLDTNLYNYVPDSSMVDSFDNDIDNVVYTDELIKRAGLTQREEKVIRLSYGFIPHKERVHKGYKLQEIADIYGLTRERIRQIKVSGIKKLRETIIEDVVNY